MEHVSSATGLCKVLETKKRFLPLKDVDDTVRSEYVRFNDTGSINKHCSVGVSGDEELRLSSCEETGTSGQGSRV